MSNIELKPGKYVLSDAVQNPKPDRRQKHDWRAEVMWPKGTEFYVTEHENHFHPEGGEKITVKFCTLAKHSGRTYHQSIPLRNPSDPNDYECFKALKLAEKLELVTNENLGDLFDGPRGIGKHMAPDLIAILIDEKLLTLDQVKAAAKKIEDMDEDAWKLMRKDHGV